PAEIMHANLFEGGISAGNMANLKTPDELDSINLKEAKEYLQKAIVNLDYPGKITTEAILGKAAEKVAEYTKKNAVDLIMIASHGRSGPSRWIWGNVADRILRSSCVPVFMVRAPACVVGI
ncbi:universal stress protein, partial [Chloroflexota bacterium]